MTDRVVGVCSACGEDLVRLAVDGELASCTCGKASIPEAIINTARQLLSPSRPRICEDAG